MADKTTGELQGVPVGELPVAPDVYDDTLIPVEQQGVAYHITGAQWKAYAVAAASAAADRATEAQRLAESYTNHPPVPGENGNWQVWNGEKYVDSGKRSEPPTEEAVVAAVLATFPVAEEASF